MTEVIIVERRFEEPVGFAEVQAREDAVAWCLEQHAVTFVRSYFAADRRSMVCVYRAPDVEAVREVQRLGKLPCERVWAAEELGSPELAAEPPRVTLVAERALEPAVTRAEVEQVLATRGNCMRIYDAQLLISHLARDGGRMLCVFAAPDAEAVRASNRKLGLPVERAWVATVITPPPR
jgi:hypothetical protein